MKPILYASSSIIVLLLAAGVAFAQQRVYFTEYKFEDPTLKVMDLDGANLEDLFAPGQTIPPADWLTVGLALDDAAGKIYWLHGSTPGRIRRADLDGGNQELILSGLKIPRGLALDAAGGKIYWSASPPAGNAGGLIQRANLNGTGLETVYLDPDYDPSWSKIGRPRVDSVNGWVYFAGNDRILRVNLDGPPFEAYTVVTGVSTARALALDVAAERIYWIGADTIEDVVCRAQLDNSGFGVVYDLSPETSGSNGLSDLVLDPAGETYLLCDDLRGVVMRGDLAGAGCDAIYSSPAGYSPSALTLDADLPQPMLDCNDNGLRDIDDVRGGASLDCNHNGIPDECEEDPCQPPDYLLDQSADPTQPGRQLGGAPQNQRWQIFQPFDVPAEGWAVGELWLHGVTWTYRPEGFTATFLPDTGGNYPDESQPLAAGDDCFRFGPEWVSISMAAALGEGRHWVRLTANAENHYLASVSTVSEGLPSMSRSGLGNDHFGMPPIALRLVRATQGTGVEPLEPAAGMALRLASPNPGLAATALDFDLPRPGAVDLSVYDIQGRLARGLLRASLPAGTHSAVWDGKDEAGRPVAAGVYFARLQSGKERASVKILRLE